MSAAKNQLCAHKLKLLVRSELDCDVRLDVRFEVRFYRRFEEVNPG